jgi:CRP/FNR family transcriptional regulator
MYDHPMTTGLCAVQRLTLCGRGDGDHEPASAFADSLFAQACAFADNVNAIAGELRDLVEHVGPYAPGERIFRSGDAFRALYVVRSGAVKTERVDFEGRVQVLGFHVPGELMGLEAIHPGRHVGDAIALETTTCCSLPFAALNILASQSPRVQRQLFRQLSRELGAVARLASDHPAENRIAAWLIDLGNRHATRGLPATRFELSMSRADIAHHLRLAPETVSRVLGRWRDRAVIALDGRRVELLDLRRLCELERCIVNA